MGAWGTGNFENDTALDWVWELQASTDLTVVEVAIADVLASSDDLDADVGSIGLAAAEIVAALRGKPLADLPQEVAGWLEAHRLAPSDALVQDCRAAVAKVRDDEGSELKELWEEDGDLAAEWYAVLDYLTARLQ